ncbi:MAG: cytochrome c biogenesis protein CcdA [Candidatus Zapsychrus exili]|nr:cytochrome c biogenesis protein CcdA [Candidatus Zapsychrus exili]
MVELTGSLKDYFIVFAAGVAVSFTPCVYPVIPITASFIAGINTKGTKLTGFIISLIYVFGVAITYCTLAVIAALTGKLFGQIQNNPITFLILSGAFFVFAIGMLDIITIPSLGISLGNKIKTKNIWTVILFGIISGLAISACTAPILGALLFYVASKQNIVRAISLVFVFSYGVGASLILIGTFSGILAKLPKPGLWLIKVKKFCGIVMLLIGVFFLIKAIGLLI